MLSLQDEPEEIIQDVNDLVETFITNIKCRRLSEYSSDGESLSTIAAVQMTDLMATIVRIFQQYEERPDGFGMQMLKAGYPVLEVSTLLVRRLLVLIARAGDALLRAQFATLLLMNVTRRVLSLLREAAANNRATVQELELEAKRLLDGLSSDDEGEEKGKPREEAPERGRPLQHVASSPNSLESSPGTQATRRRMSVRFAGSPPALEGGAPERFPRNPSRGLLHGVGGIGASEIPGQQFLRRAPSQRAGSSDPAEEGTFPVKVFPFFEDALNGIDELKSEIDGMVEELCRRAPRQLHRSDTVLTMGASRTTHRYLLQAANAGCDFKLILLEGAPGPRGPCEALAASLSRCGVGVQVLPDSSAFAVMSTCTKVLVGAESVLANGGMLAPVGTHMLCVAAKHFAVPVLVATTTLKMSPYYPNNQLCTRLVRIARTGAQEMPWSTYGSPEGVLPSPFGQSCADGGGVFGVYAPITEYVPPELIALYPTNETEFTPSQVHRFVRANYSDAD
ncbi:unnamed protein product [Phytomonas sp. Hart1]|nr:unnamed protein product [Phytomonas sp. Hart1]|eukprot:CCW71367.1 unnamed protein product [Phytomonas sp. isolate Hart1]